MLVYRIKLSFEIVINSFYLLIVLNCYMRFTSLLSLIEFNRIIVLNVDLLFCSRSKIIRAIRFISLNLYLLLFISYKIRDRIDWSLSLKYWSYKTFFIVVCSLQNLWSSRNQFVNAKQSLAWIRRYVSKLLFLSYVDCC